jgi:hypothetical protein
MLPNQIRFWDNEIGMPPVMLTLYPGRELNRYYTYNGPNGTCSVTTIWSWPFGESHICKQTIHNGTDDYGRFSSSGRFFADIIQLPPYQRSNFPVFRIPTSYKFKWPETIWETYVPDHII